MSMPVTLVAVLMCSRPLSLRDSRCDDKVRMMVNPTGTGRPSAPGGTRCVRAKLISTERERHRINWGHEGEGRVPVGWFVVPVSAQLCECGQVYLELSLGAAEPLEGLCTLPRQHRHQRLVTQPTARRQRLRPDTTHHDKRDRRQPARPGKDILCHHVFLGGQEIAVLELVRRIRDALGLLVPRIGAVDAARRLGTVAAEAGLLIHQCHVCT